MASRFKKDQGKNKSFDWCRYVIKGRIKYKGKKVYFIYQYEKANNKYMKDYGKNKESPHIQYWDVNN